MNQSNISALEMEAIGLAHGERIAGDARRPSLAMTEPAEPKILKGTPVHDNILVKKTPFRDTGNIVTPLNAQRDTGEGKLIATGGRCV